MRAGPQVQKQEFEVTYKGVKATIHADVFASVYIHTPQGHYFTTDPLPLELAHDLINGRPILRLTDLSQLDAIIEEARLKGLFIAEETHRRSEEFGRE